MESYESISKITGDMTLERVRPTGTAQKNYGILFILFGWTGVLRILLDYLKNYAYVSIISRQVIGALSYLVLIVLLAGTIYFFYKQRTEKLSYFGYQLRFVWISLILSLSLVNLTINNVLGEINFELQHPIFMVIIAFAITISGGILRNKMLILGGVIFAICGFVASYIDLRYQMLLEAIGWLAGFVIPGHLMYSKNG